MTVAQLINALAGFPPDLPVYASDHEDGLYELTRAETIEPFGGHPRMVHLG